MLFLHLSHGIASAFQSMGLNGPASSRSSASWRLALAALVAVGNLSIVFAVRFGMVPAVPLVAAG